MELLENGTPITITKTVERLGTWLLKLCSSKIMESLPIISQLASSHMNVSWAEGHT